MLFLIMGRISSVIFHSRKYPGLFMVIGSLDAMGKDVLSRKLVGCMQSLVFKRLRRHFIKLRRNCTQAAFWVAFSKSITSS